MDICPGSAGLLARTKANIKERRWGQTGNGAQFVEDLPNMHKVLGLNPQHCIKLGTVM